MPFKSAPASLLRLTITYMSATAVIGASFGPSPARAADESKYRLVVYLNFDGVTLKRGGNVAQNNETNLIGSPTFDYPALTWSRLGGKEAGLKETLDELKLLYGNYAVQLVTERPTGGDYTMAVVGGKGEGVAAGSATAVGVAPMDCKNDNPNDLALIFGDKVDSPKQLAFVIAHELGHTFGLEHVSDPKGIMAPALNAETCCFVSSPLAEGSSCGRTEQDAEAILLENLGAGEGDTVPPLVWIDRPGNGALVPPNFSFEAGSADDLRVHHVTLYVDGKKVAELDRPPYVAVLTGLEAGEHILRAETFDWKPNQVATEVTVTVDPACPAEGSCYFGTVGVGRACEAGGDCTSGLCASLGDRSRCTAGCDGDGASCPDKTACREVAGEWACVGDDEGWSLNSSAGGCAIAGEPGAKGWIALLLLAAALLARRKRRRA